MAAILGEGKIFGKLQRVHSLDTLWVENFDEIALKFKMAAIFGEGKTFKKLARVELSDTLWVENFAEIALSHTVKEIEANLCFAIFWQKF